LLARGADVNATPPSDANLFQSQGTALIAAVSGGHILVCQLLLDHGSDVNSISLDAKYPTALIAVASRNKWKICQLLLEHGVDVNLFLPNTPHCNALVISFRRNCLRSAKLLVMRRANLNIDLSTGYGIALFAAFMCRDDGNWMTKFISGGGTLPTPERNKQAQTVTKRE